jgi:hypothetical protein
LNQYQWGDQAVLDRLIHQYNTVDIAKLKRFMEIGYKYDEKKIVQIKRPVDRIKPIYGSLSGYEWC